MQKIVQISDHTPESFRAVTERRAIELFAIRKTKWSADEYRQLAQRYSDAALRMKLAVENENFAGLRSAYLDLAEICDQTAFLNGGLMNAIEHVLTARRTP